MWFAATQQALPALGGGGAGFSWWQTTGSLVVVFALLVLALRLLGRFGRARGAAEAEVLTVWSLGPRREIQILRLQDTVHYIYRHDGAMVALEQLPLAAYRAQVPAAPGRGPVAPLARFLPLAAWRRPAAREEPGRAAAGS